eukprot:jgi/Chrpa1/9230/Chrysochromulina_OHIO_Genome00016047-RA
MSGYMQVRELLQDELQNPLDVSAEHAAEDEAHDEELFDFAFGHNNMLLMAQFALLLSAAKPYLKPGRTYSVGTEIVKLHNCTCTGEETFLYMLRRLSYRLRSSWHYTTLGGRQAAVRHDNVPGAEYADCTYGSDCADCGPPRFPPHVPMSAETCNWASDADCNNGGGPG